MDPVDVHILHFFPETGAHPANVFADHDVVTGMILEVSSGHHSGAGMSDRAIDIIGGVAEGVINFSWFRDEFKVDHDLKDSLKSGHAVIDTVAELDQYLYTHALMIEHQWENVVPLLGAGFQPALLIDYGCGQGLAGVLLNDLTRGHFFRMVQDIILIEPSAVALARAAALYERIAPAATVTAVRKRFDDIHESDILSEHPGETMHVFSNSLDVLGFDPLKLLGKTLRPGLHTIVSVSHDRDFNGGTPRIEGVKAAIGDPAMASQLTVRQSTLTRFTRDNLKKTKGVVWLCQLEIEDG